MQEQARLQAERDERLLQQQTQLLTQQQAAQEERMAKLLTQFQGSASPELASRPPIFLRKMAQNEDPEAFLLTCERVAEAQGWATDRWATALAPLLIGEAQASYQGLPADQAMDYRQVKAAILDRFGLTPETYRQQFQNMKYTAKMRPRVLAQRLLDLCTRWIQPEECTKEAILEQVVLEQFLQIIPPSARSWVKHHAAETLALAVRLVENFLGAEQQASVLDPTPPALADTQRGKSDQWGTYGPSIRNRQVQRKEQSFQQGRSPNAGPRRDPHLFPDVGSSQNERNFRGRRPQDPPDAWSPVTGPAERYPQPPPAREPSPCSACGEQGHRYVDCPQMDCSFSRTVASAFTVENYKPWLLPALIEGKTVQALVDSGSGKTLVLQELLPPNVCSFDSPWSIECIHGDVKRYPTAKIQLQVNGQEAYLEVGVVPWLPAPIVLGRDWPFFSDLMAPVFHEEPPSRAQENPGKLFPFSADLFPHRHRVQKTLGSKDAWTNRTVCRNLGLKVTILVVRGHK
ncbi:uncharacterized protein LOC142487280 [Ascaphus truei]|uniref:uncharacterized protein LOC142487280 n=1 Tax=Ascaphus truei TaxID=8439 RepID=UPI003F598205